LFPWPMPSAWNADVSVVELHYGMVAHVRGRLFLLLGAVGLILLIACVNVANLALSRAARAKRKSPCAALWAQSEVAWSASFSRQAFYFLSSAGCLEFFPP